jgi:hypothetical protein
MSKLPYLIGGSALAAYLWSRGRDRKTPAAIVRPEHVEGDWIWPVPAWNGRPPVISDGYGSTRPRGVKHGGVDIMYRRTPTDPFPVGTPNGSQGFVMPDGVPVIAARDGVVWSAMKTPRGFAVVIDHGKPFATFYTHLERLLVQPTANAASKERVRAGQPIGIVGFDPLDPQRLKHLHFELWEGGPHAKIDPALAMRAWRVAQAPREALVARNGAFHYRPVGARGEPYPQWVRDLKGKSGVYLIRDASTHELLYVGSSTRRLYDTLTRHFQSWRRWKTFWKDQYAQGHDPGLTYDRDSVEVAVRITRANEALDEEARLIHRLRPRDNLLGQPVEEVPF